MKKLLSITLLATMLLVAYNAQSQLSINAGYAPVTLKSDNNGNISTSDMDGFFAGVNYNYALSGDFNLSLGAQIRYNTKTDNSGANLWGLVSVNGESTSTQLLIDVPILANYSLALSGDLKLTVFVGPAVSYALSGNTHVTGSASILGIGGSSSSDIDWYGENSDNERLDLTGVIGGALQFRQFRLFGGYRMGFLDLNKNDNVKTTSEGFFVGLGYAL